MEEAMQELLEMDNKTTYEKAIEEIDRFRVKHPNETEFANVSKKNLLKFLETPELVALRIYFATNENNENTLVFVGVDETGENILKLKPAEFTAKSTELPEDGGSQEDIDDDNFFNELQLCPPAPKPINNL